MCVYKSEEVSVRARVCVCVCTYKRDEVCVRASVCVCVCERERERERIQKGCNTHIRISFGIYLDHALLLLR